MKYIRTNLNEIYCLNDFTKSDKMVDCYVAKYFHRCINKNDIVATTDTIEELCDEYVIWLKNREIPIMERPRKEIKPQPSYFNIGECSFEKGYGAIWTDKGLIYVAKMNEKGELELL